MQYTYSASAVAEMQRMPSKVQGQIEQIRKFELKKQLPPNGVAKRLSAVGAQIGEYSITIIDPNRTYKVFLKFAVDHVNPHPCIYYIKYTPTP